MGATCSTGPAAYLSTRAVFGLGCERAGSPTCPGLHGTCSACPPVAATRQHSRQSIVGELAPIKYVALLFGRDSLRSTHSSPRVM